MAYRDEKGTFARPRSHPRSTGMGPKAYEQSAGFCASAVARIRWMPAPFTRKLPGCRTLCWNLPASKRDAALEERAKPLSTLSARPVAELAAEIGCGVPTLADILEQLVRPGRDPREDTPAPILRSDVLKMEDLSTGMRSERHRAQRGGFRHLSLISVSSRMGLLHRTQVRGDAPAGGRHRGCDHPQSGSRTRAGYQPGDGKGVSLHPLLTVF